MTETKQIYIYISNFSYKSTVILITQSYYFVLFTNTIYDALKRPSCTAALLTCALYQTDDFDSASVILTVQSFMRIETLLQIRERSGPVSQYLCWC